MGAAVSASVPPSGLAGLPGLEAHATPAQTVAEAPFGIDDVFKIGIGPSSSHTIGPMKAAATFRASLDPELDRVARLVATLHGSLAWTGRGHATDRAVILGLAGERPDRIDPDRVEAKLATILAEKVLHLSAGRTIGFDPATDVVFDVVRTFARHPNAMTFQAFDATGGVLAQEVWYSVGGGFVERDGAPDARPAGADVPHRYASADALLGLAQRTGLSLAEIALANEATRRPAAETVALVDRIADVMFTCIDRGLAGRGLLPGTLKVRRRAADLYAQLLGREQRNDRLPHETLEYVTAFAMAVNEENAAGGRVVTAPTNGAAGVIPATLRYYRDFCSDGAPAGIRTFLLTAGVIGDLIKRNASISGAEVGCQGEVGSASAMAAAGLCAVLGGSVAQVENAAEIALEHHLGMTCDPIGGLVQIPCIERNAFGAIKAIAAASLALRGDGTHRVSLDQVVATMLQTGRDMSSKYRETSRGGLAVNVPEC